MSLVKVVESPRLAWQGLAKPMPAEIKADYLRTLVAAWLKQLHALMVELFRAVDCAADGGLGAGVGVSRPAG